MNKLICRLPKWAALPAFACCLLINACQVSNTFTEGELALQRKQYFVAREYFTRKYNQVKPEQKGEAAYKAAFAARGMDDYKGASVWYARAEENNYTNAQMLREYAGVMKMNEEYEASIKIQERYLQTNPTDSLAKEEIAFLRRYLAERQSNCNVYEVEKFNLANSKFNDYSPVLLKKEGLIFTSDRTEAFGKDPYLRSGLDYSDLFMVSRIKNKRSDNWVPGARALDGVVNTGSNQGAATFDAKGSLMIYTDCNGPIDPKKPKLVRQNCVLKMARRRGKGWGEGEVLPFCTDSVLFYGQPALSPDGTKLVFALDAPNGVGKHDLYLSTYVSRSKSWSDPVNMGKVLNTRGREMFPTWFNDTTLYFSSDGRPGLGGLDMFVTYGRGDNWTRPKHLRSPLNSGGDDFGITFEANGQSGYFTSNRVGSMKDDIYKFNLRPQEYMLNGQVFLIRSVGDTIPFEQGATVNLISRDGGADSKITSGPEGKFRTNLPAQSTSTLVASAAGYTPLLDNNRSLDVSTLGWECSRDTQVKLYLTANIPIAIHGVVYKLDSTDLTPDAKKALDTVVQIMNTYPFLVIELASHTDCRASMEYNDRLSEGRARSCVNYLVSQGIDSARLVSRGYGERKLLNNCGCEPNNTGPGAHCTEAEHQINRRTTIEILRTDYAAPKSRQLDEDEEDE